MTRNLHNRQLDHDGNDLDTNIEIDGAIGDYLSGTGLHTVLTGMQAAINSGGGGGGLTPSIVYAECNTPGAASTSLQPIDFDSFYDSTFTPIDPSTDFPAGLALSWNSTTNHFECDASGIWLINMFVNLSATPSANGTIAFSTPSYGFGPSFPRTTTSPALSATAAYTVIGSLGDDFFVTKQSASGTPTLASYVGLEIVHIGGPFTG